MNNNDRSKSVKRGISFSFLWKGLDGLAFFILVPLSIDFMGNKIYSDWISINSILIWLCQLDLGLGDYMRNKLTCHLGLGKEKEARQTLSSTVFTMIFLSFLYLLLLLLFHVFVKSDMGVFADSAVLQKDRLMAFEFAILLSLIVLNLRIIDKIYHALIQPSTESLISFIIRLVTCLILLVFIHFKVTCSLILIVITFLMIQILIYSIFGARLFRNKGCLKPSLRLVNYSQIIEGLKTSLLFFILHIFTPVFFSIATMYAYSNFSSDDVISMSISNKYLSIALVAFTTISGSMWNATTDAATQGDAQWIQSTYKELCKVGVATFVIILFMIAFCQPIFYLWIGDKVNIPVTTTALMGIVVFSNLWNYGHTMLLRAIGIKLKKCCAVTIFAVVASIVIMPISANIYGVNGLIVSMSICYIIVATYSTLQVRSYLSSIYS